MSIGHLLAIAIVCGSALGAASAAPPAAAWAAAFGVLSLAVAAPGGMVRSTFVVLACAGAAAGHAARARDLARAPPLLAWFHQAGPGPEGRRTSPPVVIDGVLLEDAEPARGGGVRLRLAVRRLRVADRWEEAPGRVQLHVAGAQATTARVQWTRGRRVEAPVALRQPTTALNPGGPNRQREALRRGYVLAGSVKSAALVSVTPGAWWDERAADVRRRVRDAARELLGASGAATAAIVTAILIGDRAGLDPGLERRLMEAGTYHVIAISGGNVAILVAVVLFGFRQVVRSRRVLSLMALAAVGVYGSIVGGDPSVTRAVTAASVWLIADVAGIAAKPLNILGVVAILIVLSDPIMVIMPGAWLSFGATFGILVCARFLSALIPQRPAARAGPGSRLLRVVLGLFAATLAAELILLPVGAGVFSRVSVAGLVLNFIAIPAMTMVQLAGMTLVGCFEVWPGGAKAAAALAAAATALLVESTQLVVWLPWLSWRVPPSSATLIVAFYASMGLTVLLKGHRQWQRAAGGAFLASLLAIVSAPGVEAAAPPPGWLRVTMLDVGQGDAIAVQFPGGRALLVDAGGSSSGAFDVGERVVTPALWALGTRRLEWLAFTHADLDHIGGMLAVADEFRPREIWEGVPVPRDVHRGALRAGAGGRDIAWRELRRGDRLSIGAVVLDALNPPVPDWERQRVRNDDSLVLRLRYGDLEIVLTGDISRLVENDLHLDDGDRREVRILKAAHHGSRTSSSSELVNGYRPFAALISAGRSNAFGHPAPDVLARFDESGAHVFRTDQDGAIMVETDGHEIRLRTWTGRSWTIFVLPGPSSAPLAGPS